METPKSPRDQSQFPAVGYESRHDIELQSPIRSSSYMMEKFPDPPESSDTTQQQEHRVSYVGLGRPVPVRKYSQEWWKRSWDGAIAERVWPRVIYASFGFVMICIWIGATIYFAAEESHWDRGEDQPFEQRRRAAAQAGASDDTETLISLSGSLKSFDPVARSLSVEWSGLFQDNKLSDPVDLANGTYPNTRMPLEIFRDVSTVLYDVRSNSSTTDTTTGATTDTAEYWFRIDNSTVAPVGTIGVHTWDSFSTDISFSQWAEESNAMNQPQYSYPFDKWKGGLVFVASYESPNEKVVMNTRQGNYTHASVFPLSGARLEDNSLNWRFHLNFENPCFSDMGNITSIIEKGRGPSDDTVDTILTRDSVLAFYDIPCHLAITIEATRPLLVQFAAVMAVLVNWTSTLFIFILTCEVIIMRRGFMLSGTDLLGITFTALFALPSVRMLLPGAPEFGILLDLVGIIPKVIIVSLCITAIAITKLNRRRHPDQKED